MAQNVANPVVDCMSKLLLCEAALQKLCLA
jgi:hypothetical protein